MKKINFVGMLLLSTTIAFSQDIAVEESTSTESGSLSFKAKNGQEVLPQAGDWGIGIGATNTISYFGNLLNGNTNNNGGSSPFSFANENIPSTVVYGKLFVSSELAYRGFARLSYNRIVTKAEVRADLETNPDIYVTDKRTTRSSGVTVGAGLENRRGSGRLIGVYGAQAFINLDQNLKTSYDYGNGYSVNNANPTDAGLQNSNTVAPDPAFGDRLLSTSQGSGFGVGAQLFLGAEYYFAPKMSIGGEFYWGITYTNNAISSEKWEAFEPTTSEVTEYVSKSVGGNQISAGLSNLGGAVNLMLYF